MAAAPTPQGAPRPSAPQAPTQDNNQPFDVFSQDMAFPGLPGAAKHQPSKAAAYESKVPDLDAGMLTSLPAAQQARLTAERDSVAQLDQQVYKVNTDIITTLITSVLVLLCTRYLLRVSKSSSMRQRLLTSDTCMLLSFLLDWSHLVTTN